MNPAPASSHRPRNPLPVILGLTLALPFLAVTLLALGVASYFRLGGDARALRNSLMKSSAAPWRKTVEVNVGCWTLGLARTALECVKLNADARSALESARGAQVGVYRLGEEAARLDRAALLAAADEAMTQRGWDRVVGVIHQHELVAAYVPRNIDDPQDLRVCVAFVDRDNLIVAAARSNLEPLVNLALRHARREGGGANGDSPWAALKL